MRGAVVLVAIAVAGTLAGGCGKKRQRRTSDAAPVEIVTRPLLEDAGSEGATSDEVEPNDGTEIATPLPLGSTARGRIDPDGDHDHYRIDVTAPGALVVELTGIDGVDLALEVDDATGTTIARSDRSGARVAEGIPNVGVTPGRYIVTVRGKKIVPPSKKRGRRRRGKQPPADPGPQVPAPVYEITARVAPIAAAAEREPNDDRGTAMDLIVGDTVTGYVGWNGDDDVWKLSVETLSDKNAIDVEVSAVEDTALVVEVADGVGRTLVTRKGGRGGALSLRGLVPVVPAGAPPFHYLTIKGDRSNPRTAYQLRVTAKLPEPDAEREPNDTVETAMAVPADRTVVHATWSPGDVDCFVLAADPAARTLEITIDTPAEADLSAELLVGDKVIAKAAQPGKGAAERVTGAVPAGAQPVIRVRGTDRSGEGAYDVTIAEGPAPAP